MVGGTGCSVLLVMAGGSLFGLLLFAVVAAVVAVLFSNRPEPIERLLKLIKALRRR
jgi:hypothetical protein